MQDHENVYVWDRFIRVSHWLLIAAFTIAFVTEDDAMLVHVWAGYLVGALVVARTIWGLVGPKYARFQDFVYRPETVVAYVRDLFLFRAKRFVGHSPGGGAMVLALLLGLALTVASGLVVYGAREHAGPLAGLFASPSLDSAQPGAPVSVQRDSDDKQTRGVGIVKRKKERSVFARTLKEIHEFLANLTLALVLVHVGGVVLASLVHRENLVRAMINGDKRR